MTMDLTKRLQALSSDKPSGWLQKAEERKQNRNWQKRSAAIALRVLRELRYQGLTQRDLAEKMGVAAQQVNKIVKGQENMTLDTLVKLETALGIQLLHDGKPQPMAVLGFRSLPVAEKISRGFATYHHGSYMASTCVLGGGFSLDIDITAAFENANEKQLHTQYPVPGKEKWLRRHTEFS
ncbi:helix-turn-helix transcriptional regulator [Flavisolibacter ginsenosidimutans]|uniref:Helix-turn-helix transcriptional regulator n=1 Tax=Flavisolibacter ginsenosidimutans TaxID=661481 RepID=A0A5B8UJH6_9BACT|nr:helix-turn-helix transcriptional regulator [Flavisolibacter ginsenosidimutans]QEC56703.1 helix-turn-helix transcriptional regulator [Flavisolibacter ginsenosidimutans]